MRGARGDRVRLHRRGGRARAVVVVVSRRGDDARSSSIDRRGGARSRSLCETTRRRPTNDDAPSIENRFRGGGASRIAFIRRAALSHRRSRTVIRGGGASRIAFIRRAALSRAEAASPVPPPPPPSLASQHTLAPRRAPRRAAAENDSLMVVGRSVDPAVTEWCGVPVPRRPRWPAERMKISGFMAQVRGDVIRKKNCGAA